MSLCKLYQIGAKFFCCNGKMVWGNNNQKLLLSFLPLFVFPIIFLIFEYHNSPHHDPIDDNLTYTPIIVVFAIISFLAFSSCAFTDPGIIRKQAFLSVEIQNIENITLFCEICKTERPNSRTKHCKICDVCVEEMDHHCGWMGNCIGRRTRRRFFLTIHAISLFLIFMAVLCFIRFRNEFYRSPPPETIYRMFYLGFFAFVYCFCGVFSCSLMLFHCFLIATQQTTIEFLTGHYKFERNPYDKGLLSNCFDAFCQRNRRTAQIDLEYLRKTEEAGTTDISRF